MLDKNETTANKAQTSLDQLSCGKKTLNQVREQYNLDSIDENVANEYVTKA